MAIRDMFKTLFGADLPDPDLCIYRNESVTSEDRVQICSVLIDKGDPALRARFFNGRGSAYRDLGEAAAAKADYDSGVALDPENATLLHNRAVLAYEEDDFHASIADADRVIALEPDRGRGYEDRSDAFYGLGDYETALRAIDRALDLEAPTDYRLYAKGRVLVQMGRYHEAIAPLDASIERDPAYRNAIERRTTAHAMLGNRDAQLRDIERLLALDPDDVEAHGSLTLLYALSDPDRALAHCAKVLALEPDNAPVLDTRGAILERKGDLAGAQADIDRAVALWPHEPTFRSNRAIHRIASGDLAGAQADIQEGLALDPERDSLLIGQAHLAVVRGDPTKAEAMIADIFSRGADDGAATCVRGLARLASGDDAGARTAFGEVLSRRFDGRAEIMGVRLRWTALQGRAIARSRAGDSAGSEADSAAARALRPDAVDIFERWGFATGAAHVGNATARGA